MSEYLIQSTTLNSIAKAIKTKNLTTAPIDAADFELKILQLPSLEMPQHPEIAYDEEKASEIVEVAQSYLDAISDGRLTIVYKAGYSTLSGTNQVLKNENDVYCINCSAFVGLILRGICYEDSPFYDGDGSKVTARTDLYSWANTYYEKNGYTEANQLAFYAFTSGCMLVSKHPEMIKKGDILFFSKGTGRYFANIWHVAIALEDGGTKCVHALNGNSVGIWTFDMTSPPSILGDLYYIARPQYNINFSETTDTVSLEILEHPTNQSGAAGTNAVFTVAAQGEGLTYQWQYAKASTPNNWQNSTFDGYNTDTQIVDIASYRDGDWYRCVITDKYGNTIISNAASMTMTS